MLQHLCHRALRPHPAVHALLLAAGLALTAAPAAALELAYTGSGSVLPAGLPDRDGNLPLQVPARLTDYDFGFGRAWRLESSFVSNLFSGEGYGEFRFLSALGSLGGELTARAAQVGEFGGFELSFTVTAGTGLWAGFEGQGQALVTLLGPPTRFPTPYAEAGTLSIARQEVAAVPEPGAAALWAAGGLVMGWRLVRRRVGGGTDA